jgi:hypothetical protein
LRSSNGFCDLIAANYICAAPLVRLQLGNMLRFSALWLVADPQDFVMNVMVGKQINGLNDKNGKRMTDRRLVDQMETRFPGVKAIYDDACG